MRIACTTCNAVYELPPDRVKPGRGVRCARCGTVWTPVERDNATPLFQPDPPPPPPEAEPIRVAFTVEPEPEPDPAVLPAPLEPTPPPAPRSSGRLPLLAAWLLSLALIPAATWFLLSHRPAVIGAWPPAERLYDALGIHR